MSLRRLLLPPACFKADSLGHTPTNRPRALSSRCVPQLYFSFLYSVVPVSSFLSLWFNLVWWRRLPYIVLPGMTVILENLITGSNCDSSRALKLYLLDKERTLTSVTWPVKQRYPPRQQRTMKCLFGELEGERVVLEIYHNHLHSDFSI